MPEWLPGILLLLLALIIGITLVKWIVIGFINTFRDTRGPAKRLFDEFYESMRPVAKVAAEQQEFREKNPLLDKDKVPIEMLDAFLPGARPYYESNKEAKPGPNKYVWELATELDGAMRAVSDVIENEVSVHDSGTRSVKRQVIYEAIDRLNWILTDVWDVVGKLELAGRLETKYRRQGWVRRWMFRKWGYRHELLMFRVRTGEDGEDAVPDEELVRLLPFDARHIRIDDTRQKGTAERLFDDFDRSIKPAQKATIRLRKNHSGSAVLDARELPFEMLTDLKPGGRPFFAENKRARPGVNSYLWQVATHLDRGCEAAAKIVHDKVAALGPDTKTIDRQIAYDTADQLDRTLNRTWESYLKLQLASRLERQYRSLGWFRKWSFRKWGHRLRYREFRARSSKEVNDRIPFAEFVRLLPYSDGRQTSR